MSSRGTRREGSLQAKLDAAFRQTGLSHRQLARLLIGPDATDKQVEHRRSQISRWRNKEEVGISAQNSKALATAFGKAGLILPPDYFLSEPRQVAADELADLRRRIEALERRVG